MKSLFCAAGLALGLASLPSLLSAAPDKPGAMRYRMVAISDSEWIDPRKGDLFAVVDALRERDDNEDR